MRGALRNRRAREALQPDMFGAALGLWLLFLVGAVFYVRRARHPEVKPVAAYLIFVIVFTAVSFVLFGAFAALLQLAGWAGVLATPIGAAVFLIAVFLPALLAARWQLRKPPMGSPRP